MVICVSNPVVQRAQADEIPGTCSRYNQATPLGASGTAALTYATTCPKYTIKALSFRDLRLTRVPLRCILR